MMLTAIITTTHELTTTSFHPRTPTPTPLSSSLSLHERNNGMGMISLAECGIQDPPWLRNTSRILTIYNPLHGTASTTSGFSSVGRASD